MLNKRKSSAKHDLTWERLGRRLEVECCLLLRLACDVVQQRAPRLGRLARASSSRHFWAANTTNIHSSVQQVQTQKATLRNKYASKRLLEARGVLERGRQELGMESNCSKTIKQNAQRPLFTSDILQKPQSWKYSNSLIERGPNNKIFVKTTYSYIRNRFKRYGQKYPESMTKSWRLPLLLDSTWG